MLFVLAARKMMRSASSFVLAVTGLLFATHPIHTDAVSSINNRTEMLSGTFVLLSFLAYVSGAERGGYVRVVVSVVLAVLAMLCKEQGITVVAISAAYDVAVVCDLDAWGLLHALLGRAKTKTDDNDDINTNDTDKPKGKHGGDKTSAPANDEPERRVPPHVAAMLKRVSLALALTAAVMFLRLRVDFTVTHDVQTNRLHVPCCAALMRALQRQTT